MPLKTISNSSLNLLNNIEPGPFTVLYLVASLQILLMYQLLSFGCCRSKKVIITGLVNNIEFISCYQFDGNAFQVQIACLENYLITLTTTHANLVFFYTAISLQFGFGSFDPLFRVLAAFNAALCTFESFTVQLKSMY